VIRFSSVDAAQLLSRLAGRRADDVRIAAPNTLPLRADADRLEAALAHLLDAAATPLTLAATLTPEGCVRFAVGDCSAGVELDAVQAVARAHGGAVGREGTTAWLAVPTFRGL
jgi:hypothetical protein